ncbi:MAG: two-component system sensor histidine kinase CreC [Gemmatimonadota bacterium]
MSTRSRIFIGIFVVYLAAVGALLYRVAADFDPRYRESAEESLVDTANLLATLLERRTYDGVIPTDELERTLTELARRPVYARIFDIEKRKIDLHVYVTDRDGTVLFDSQGKDVGANYLDWRDVSRTLEGHYGARTTLAIPNDPTSAVMYVGAPIRERTAASRDPAGDIVGMVSVGKPIASIRPFIVNAREKLALVGVISTLGFAVLLLFATVWLVRPFGFVRDVWRTLAREPGSIGTLGRRFVHAVRTAFADMRDALAGRSYVDQYVQTLTHELKSPLAAIRGAAELLRERMPEATRAHFAGNIEEQVQRAQKLIDRLLELSSLERRAALDHTEAVSLVQAAYAARDELATLAAQKDIEVAITADANATIEGDAFLLQRAVANLLANAIDFAPRASRIDIAVRAADRQVELIVRDRGPGLPEYARDRAFEKFFSLARPDTGKKSTGLGLALVKEVAALHGGTARLANHPDGGAVATLILPRPKLR